MIRARYQLTRPDDADASLTLTMTVGEWRAFAAHLVKDGKYPGWRIANIIHELVESATVHFDATGETEQP